jgi:crotonobetainyl-CoA:carnitine CoA-transferase CaiB-like acyl-CoA transferase
MSDVKPTETPADAPLSGLRVVDLSVTLPGPYCTQVLRRLGASVLHLEPPGGDTLRWVAPTSFAFLAQGKESVVVDLKDPTDHHLAMAQLAQADVVIQGWRPGVAERLGVGYSDVAAVNPRVVYASLFGYSSDGPKAQRPGHDVNYAAEAGAVDLVRVDGLPVGDLAGATSAAVRVLASVIRAMKSGEGAHIEVSITGALQQWVDAVGGADYREFLTVYSAPHYGIFDLADGARIALGVAQEEGLWASLITALGRPEWAELSYRDRVLEGPRIQEYIAKTLRTMSSADAVGVFEPIDTCWNLVQEPGQSPVPGGRMPNPGGRVPAPNEHGDTDRH